MSDLDRLDEEFNNFMFRVNEVESIIKKLASKDKSLQDVGTLEAKKYLDMDKSVENINENSVELVIKSDRSLINKKALEAENDPKTMSQGNQKRPSCSGIHTFEIIHFRSFHEGSRKRRRRTLQRQNDPKRTE